MIARQSSPSHNEGILTPSDLERLAEVVVEKLAARLADQPKLVDRVRLAEMLGIGTATVERRTADGTFPSVKIGRRVLYRPESVIAALEQSDDGEA